jgi:hypothetical protein
MLNLSYGGAISDQKNKNEDFVKDHYYMTILVQSIL